MSKTNPASDRAAINRAKRLLEKNGYTVAKYRPDPRIGDVVRFHEGDKPYDVLITFYQTDSVTPEDVYAFGGVQVGRGTYLQLCTEPLWIDQNEWQKDDGQYEVIGHIDLSGITLIHP